MNLFNQMPVERLELEAGWIVEVVAENLSCQEDAELHHLLQCSAAAGLRRDFIGQLRQERNTHNQTGGEHTHTTWEGG